MQLDWQNEYYTKSPKFTKFVQESFVKLKEKGLIYRQEKFVNWCSQLQTAVADIEVEHERIMHDSLVDVPGCNQVPFGLMFRLWFGKEISVWTSRPETSFGDVALCVHPEDKRYQKFIGKSFLHPITKKMLPLISDSSVNRELGSGIVKLTPAVSQSDCEVAVRNGLVNSPQFLTDTGLICCPEMPRYHVT